jgi:glycosyltransferase involved in cell wall biosynthesis
MRYDAAILIPVYKAENTFERSIKSIVDQKNLPENLEKVYVYVLYNGLQFDKDKNIIQKYNEIIDKFSKNNKFIFLENYIQEKGIVSALNYGIFKVFENYPKCKYIFRQDADDFWYSEKMAKQLDFLESNKDIDILGTNIRFVNTKFEPLGYSNYPEENENIVSNMLSGENAIAHPTVAIRTKIFLKTGGYDDIYPFAEDFNLWLKCIIKNFKFHNLQEVLLDYTKTSNPNYDPLSPQIAASNAILALRYFGDREK